ncbi:MAG TPA: alpha/beta fold hydrolase, partial [Urbifossiella sp.]|nr:alpha/beta fold hydrolase [Urbifossiella sp.]
MRDLTPSLPRPRPPDYPQPGPPARRLLIRIVMADTEHPPRPVTLSLPDGGELIGDYAPAASTPADFAVVWVHGFGSHRGGEKAAAVRAECGRRGWAFAAFDFRAHGASPGRVLDLTATGLLADLGAIASFLVSKGHTRLGLVGSSMGGFAAAWFAAAHTDSVVGCVLLAPAFGFIPRRWDKLTKAEREDWKRTGRLRVKNQWVDTEIGYALAEERDQFRPADLAAKWRTP